MTRSSWQFMHHAAWQWFNCICDTIWIIAQPIFNTPDSNKQRLRPHIITAMFKTILCFWCYRSYDGPASCNAAAPYWTLHRRQSRVRAGPITSLSEWLTCMIQMQGLLGCIVDSTAQQCYLSVSTQLSGDCCLKPKLVSDNGGVRYSMTNILEVCIVNNYLIS